MRRSVASMTRAALLGGLTFVLGLFRIPVGPVPVTLQTFGVLMAGLVLRPWEAFFAMLLHLALKLIVGGGAAVLSPAFGFVIAFVVIAPLMALVMPRVRGRAWLEGAVIVLASLALYVIGLPYMAWILRVYMGKVLSFRELLMTGMVIFLPGDALKALLAWAVGRRVVRVTQPRATMPS